MTAPPSPARPLRLAGGVSRAGRHATWLELFFDLVFVVAVSNLAGVLLRDASPRGILAFIGLFVPVWWAWIGISYWIDQFALPEVAERLLMLQQITLALALAVGLPRVVAGDVRLFAGAYIGLRVTLTALYAWSAWTIPDARTLCGKYSAGFALGTALWALALAPMPDRVRFGLWGAALVLEIATTVWAYVSTRDIPAQESHMPERFGLFTLIVLGESVLAVATGGAHGEGAGGWTVAGAGVVLAFCVWWLYFDYADEGVINRALRGGQQALYLSFLYGYTHLLVFAGIVATSVGIEHAFEDVTHGHLAGATRLTLCGGLTVYLLALTVVQRAEPCELPAPIVAARLGAAVLVALLGALAPALPPALVVTAVALVPAVLIAVEWHILPANSEGQEIGVGTAAAS